MKELLEIKKIIPHSVKVKIATNIRDYRDVADRFIDPNEFDHSVEVFNNTNILRDPDRVGITVYYPNKEEPTHFDTKIFDLSIGGKGFGKQLEKITEQLKDKARNGNS